jgi:hypothetical protein
MNLLEQIEVNILSERNRQLFYLSQHVEYKIENNQIMFYNTLFDSVLFLTLKPNDNAGIFVDKLKNGVDNIQAYIASYFPINSDSVYKVLIHRRVIE